MYKNLSHRQRCALILLIALAAVVFPSAVAAQATDEELERDAQAIDKMIMCPVCPAETIDQAQVEISFQMRAIIREMLAEGRSREEILDYFVDRYGPDILAAPPKSGANLVAWILPVAGVAAGLALLFLIVRSMTRHTGLPSVAFVGAGRNRSQASATEHREEGETMLPPEADLSAYLEIVDRTLAVRRGRRPDQGSQSHASTDANADGATRRESPRNG